MGTHMTDWLTAIGTLSAVVVALLLAIFHEHLRAVLWRPKLEIALGNRPPDCHLTTLTNCNTGFQTSCYYFRFRVRNGGNANAETVEAYIEEVFERKADGEFTKWQGFLPLSLVWSHFGKVYIQSIPPRRLQTL